MEIWQFNDPEPLRPFLRVLQNDAPHLVESARRLTNKNGGATRADLVCLAQGLVHRAENVRAAVRVLIFSPPVEDELSHFRRLLRWFPFWLPPSWHKYSFLTRLVAELASCLDNLQGCSPIATALQVALKQRSTKRPQDVAHLTLLRQPKARRHLISILARRLPYSLTPGLKRRLLESTDFSGGQIYEMLAAAKRFSPTGAYRYWRKIEQVANVSRPAVLNSSTQPTKKSCQTAAGDLRILSWGQSRPEEIAYLEKLINYQCNELVEVYNLAKEVSQRTKRVVLTLHNASLGAATGWGMPSFAQQVSDSTSTAFVDRVNSSRRDFAAKLGQSLQSSHCRSSQHLKSQADSLLLLWGKRLVRPRLLQDLWALRVSLLLNDLPIQEWQQFFSQAKELLNEDDYRRLIRGKGLTISFEPPAISRQRLHETLFWFSDRKEKHAALLSLLWGLIEAGEEWLQAERFPHLVLPIIDKFFISSQRDKDLEYLPLFVELASINDRVPLFLLIDDTSRAESPSLQLAIKRWRQKHPFLGLGIFSCNSKRIATPLETILAGSSQTNLFALRPLTQVHNPVSFDALLTQRPHEFLTAAQYDSSWKDNLPFLYHSTQVAPLAGLGKLTNPFSPAVVTSMGPIPFGTYYRCRLRQLALKRLGIMETENLAGKSRTSSLELLWREYAELTNLL